VSGVRARQNIHFSSLPCACTPCNEKLFNRREHHGEREEDAQMLQKVDLSEKANSIPELFRYLEVGRLNDHVLNVLQAEDRTLDFHVHERSDELFYVIEGSFEIELDDGIISMSRGEMLIVPKGVRHRPVCKKLVKCLLIEIAGTLNAGNTGGAYAARTDR
jgi:mannose-6-phosphate isomerase-like protein (cupin superfamily)